MQQKGYTRENERPEPQKMKGLEDDSPFQTRELSGSSRWFFKMFSWLVDWEFWKLIDYQINELSYKWTRWITTYCMTL